MFKKRGRGWGGGPERGIGPPLGGRRGGFKFSPHLLGAGKRGRGGAHARGMGFEGPGGRGPGGGRGPRGAGGRFPPGPTGPQFLEREKGGPKIFGFSRGKRGGGRKGKWATPFQKKKEEKGKKKKKKRKIFRGNFKIAFAPF